MDDRDTNQVSPSEEGNDSDSESPPPEMRGIEYPGKHDVKLGRGGDANSHIGNIRFRELIRQYKPRYVAASRSNKPFVAEEVVRMWRNLDPPGRFLTRTNEGDDSAWHDVGNRRARKKASQALREKDRSEDMIAAMAPGGHLGFPGGMPMMHPAVASMQPIPSYPTMAMPPVGQPAAAAPPLPAAAAGPPPASIGAPAPSVGTSSATTSTNNNREESRKRSREQDAASIGQDQERKVAARPSAPIMDAHLAAEALRKLLQPASGLAPAPPPAPMVLPPVASQAQPTYQPQASSVPQAQPPSVPQIQVSPPPPAPVPPPALQMLAPQPQVPQVQPSVPPPAASYSASPAQAPAPPQDPTGALTSLLPSLKLLLQQKKQQEELEQQVQNTLSTVGKSLQALLQSLLSSSTSQDPQGGSNSTALQLMTILALQLTSQMSSNGGAPPAAASTASENMANHNATTPPTNQFQAASAISHVSAQGPTSSHQPVATAPAPVQFAPTGGFPPSIHLPSSAPVVTSQRNHAPTTTTVASNQHFTAAGTNQHSNVVAAPAAAHVQPAASSTVSNSLVPLAAAAAAPTTTQVAPLLSQTQQMVASNQQAPEQNVDPMLITRLLESLLTSNGNNTIQQ